MNNRHGLLAVVLLVAVLSAEGHFDSSSGQVTCYESNSVPEYEAHSIAGQKARPRVCFTANSKSECTFGYHCKANFDNPVGYQLLCCSYTQPVDIFDTFTDPRLPADAEGDLGCGRDRLGPMLYTLMRSPARGADPPLECNPKADLCPAGTRCRYSSLYGHGVCCLLTSTKKRRR